MQLPQLKTGPSYFVQLHYPLENQLNNLRSKLAVCFLEYFVHRLTVCLYLRRYLAAQPIFYCFQDQIQGYFLDFRRSDKPLLIRYHE